jgi:hypothetical protein
MDNSMFKKKLDEIVKEVGSIPSPQKEKLIKLAKKAEKNHSKLNKNIETLHQSIDYLRVCVKYLLFDLEATKRENARFKKIIEDSNGQQ